MKGFTDGKTYWGRDMEIVEGDFAWVCDTVSSSRRIVRGRVFGVAVVVSGGLL